MVGNQPPTVGPDRCSVYLRLPYIGSNSNVYGMRVKTAVTKCFYSVSPRIIFCSRPILPGATKDVLPTLHKSDVIYQYTCSCDQKYVGRTGQRLLARIRQHVPIYLLEVKKTGIPTTRTPSTAIGKHLKANQVCLESYTDNRFGILNQGRSEFHLSVLESLYISSKQPALCTQKKSVYSTLLYEPVKVRTKRVNFI